MSKRVTLTDMAEDELKLAVSTLMIDVMRLRNHYKYDTVAPKAFNDEMDFAYHKALRSLNAYTTNKIIEARIDELARMQVRTMNDPDDDTNVFWYRTYTMPEFEARITELTGAQSAAKVAVILKDLKK